jgi:hypothetical protein
MLTKPKRAWKQIISGLGFEFNQEKFQFALKESTFEKMSELEDNDGFNEVGKGEKFFRSGKIGQWKNKLTLDQIYKIEDFNGETMKRLGYILHREDRRNKLMKIKSVATATVRDSNKENK